MAAGALELGVFVVAEPEGSLMGRLAGGRDRDLLGNPRRQGALRMARGTRGALGGLMMADLTSARWLERELGPGPSEVTR
jgi:hypothetical protein